MDPRYAHPDNTGVGYYHTARPAVNTAAEADNGYRIPPEYPRKVAATTEQDAEAQDEEIHVAETQDALDGPNRLKHDLKEWQVGMIALSATIGRGLTIGSSKILSTVGPGGGTLIYAFAGILMWFVIATIGEMAALLPERGPFYEFPARFLDDAAGFTSAWMYCFAYVIIFPSQVAASSAILQYHYTEPETGNEHRMGQADTIDVRVYIFPLWIAAVAINLLPVKWLGRIEYVFGWIKITGILFLALSMVVINLLRDPLSDAVDIPRPIKDYFWTECAPSANRNCTEGAWGFMPTTFTADDRQFSGGLARFLALWTSLTLVFFSYLGADFVAVAAAETKNPAKSIKLTSRKVILRAFILYTLAFLTVGFNVPYDHKKLSTFHTRAVKAADSLGASSPFIVAAVESGREALPKAMNIFFVFAAWSAGLTSIYGSSRTMHALADQNRIPIKVLRQKLAYCSAGGVPRNAVILSGIFGALAFLYNGKDAHVKASYEVLQKLASAGTVFLLIVFFIVCIAGVRFQQGLRYANIFRDRVEMEEHNQKVPQGQRQEYNYPWKPSGQPYMAYAGALICFLIVIFNGWYEFELRRKNLRGSYAAAAYVPVAVFIVIYLGRKLLKREGPTRSWFRSKENMNFRGMQTVDPRKKKISFGQKLWRYVR